MKIRRTIYSKDVVGEIIQSMIDAGFTNVKFEECDGSTIGQKDYLYIEADTCNWKVID